MDRRSALDADRGGVTWFEFVSQSNRNLPRWKARIIMSGRILSFRSILIVSTLPDELNTNKSINQSISRALKRISPQALISEYSAALARDAIHALKPDLILGVGSIVRDDVSYASLWHAATAVGATLAYWLFDDPYERDFNHKLSNRCHMVFTTDRASTHYYGETPVTHLPLAADSEQHFRPHVPLEERPIDVFFCGVAYPNRRAMIDKLRHRLGELKTLIRGDGWDERLKFCSNQRMTPKEIIDGYTSAKIVLTLGRQFNIANSHYEIVPSTPGPRTFEAAAAGCVQVAFLESLELFEYFAEGEEVLAYNTVSEFANLTAEVIANPTTFDRVARAAQSRALEDHTFDHRCRRMLDVLATQNALLPHQRGSV